MKECAVVVRCIHKTIAGGHVYGVCARSVVRPIFRRAGQMQSGAVCPSGHDAFAELILVNLWLGGGLNLRQAQAVALLHVEYGVVAEKKRGALVLFLVLVGLFVFGE